MDKATYTVKELAGLLGTSLNATYDAIHRGQLPVPVFRVGSKILLPKLAVDKMLAGDAGAPEA